MTKVKKKPNFKLIFGTVLFITLVLSIIYAIVSMIMAPEVSDEPYEKIKSDYSLMLLQCSLGMVVMFIPSLLQKKLSLTIPNYMFVLYFIFLFCTIYLGEVQDFYFIIPYWDLLLHTFSGAMLGSLGFTLVSLLNSNKNVDMHLSPFFIAFFAFCFALAFGVVWEIYEYTVDSVAALNMQKYALEDGTLLVGREALADTMEDLIVDAVGALVMCIFGYISVKRKQGGKNEALGGKTA